MSRFHHILVSFNPKIAVKIIVLTILIATISACNTESTQQSFNNTKNEYVTNKVFLIGSNANLENTISDMVEKAGIRKGGFVVIIPTSFTTNDKRANLIKKQFNDLNIMAVHILKFDPKSTIKKTDVITIENASIICILGGSPNKFVKLAKSTRLKESLLTAKENGTLVAGFGKGASVLGEHFYIQGKMDTLTNKKKLWFIPGLGILKNTVVGDISLLKGRTKDIQKESTKKIFTFIGLGNKTSVFIEDSVGTVLSKAGINLISPDKEPKNLGKGDVFSLLAQ